MLCFVMSRCIMLCYIVLCNALLRYYVKLRCANHIMLRSVALCFIMLHFYRAIIRYATLYIMLCYVIFATSCSYFSMC